MLALAFCRSSIWRVKRRNGPESVPTLMASIVKKIIADGQRDEIAERIEERIGIAQPDAHDACAPLGAQALPGALVILVQRIIRRAAGAQFFGARELFFEKIKEPRTGFARFLPVGHR